MSDSANKDYFSWLRSVTADPAAGDNGAAEDAAPDDNPLPFAAPGGMPIFPSVSLASRNGANRGCAPRSHRQ
jgi:hypothetical protein